MYELNLQFTDAIIKVVFLFEKGYGVENEKNYGSF